MWFLILAALVPATLGFDIRACANVDMVTRQDWNARPPRSITYNPLPVSYLFIHHTAGAECHSRSACNSQMRGIQNYHMDSNGWNDIGYNFLVGGDGGVYEGRNWDKVGAHTSGYNSLGVAICFIGDFTGHLPTNQQEQAAFDLIDCAEKQGVLTSGYRMFGHRDGGCTACPGNTLYPEIQTWPHYSFDDIPGGC